MRHRNRALPSSVKTSHRIPVILLVFGLLWGATPAFAEDWLRIRIPGAQRDLWVDLEQRQVFVAGRCEVPLEPERFTQSGDRLELELREPLRGDLPHGPIEVEQSMELVVVGDRGSLRIESPTAAGALAITVTVERGGRGCR